ncbi:hypothetical protein [Polaribacter atrinae]|uniref:hypothetical protein n=1 Tax=Polaribacter atrinae TaxID=1333662 RepID=UPI0030F5FF36
MKIIKFIIILFVSFKNFGQTKSVIFHNENGEQVTKEQFYKTKDNRKNLDLYFEKDSIQYGVLIKRQRFGQLDKKTFRTLKNYVTELSDVTIDTTQNIVINYLTANTKKIDNKKSKSTWNVLDKNYLKKLHKIANINQFWINSPECDNLNYYHQNKINWITDNDDLFKKIFFPYQVKDANYILIKPDGKFYYYIGEHSKYQIWELSKKYFN